jgi:hypothetical protein
MHQGDDLAIEEPVNKETVTSSIINEDPATVDDLATCSRHTESQSESCAESSAPQIELGSNPSTWPEIITDEMRIILVTNGPVSPKIDFKYPVDELGRRFSPKCVRRELRNGEVFIRSWVVYSENVDAIFCFCCKLFSANNKISLTTEGFRDWRNLFSALEQHERSPKHIRALTQWVELRTRLRANSTLDSQLQKALEEETHRWKAVLERLLTIIMFLAEQCLALRGTSDVLFEKNNGNFLKTVELLAKFDSIMAEHVRRIKDKKTHVHYLSHDIQNELIHLLAERIRCRILDRLKLAKYYSIIVDCTPDISKVEQMSVILRFIHIEGIGDTAEIIFCEYFLEFFPAEKSTGEALTQYILKVLQKYNIPLENMRGQGYDNGSNMKGKLSGVQRRILNLNSRAFYIPCYAHSLNLVVNDAANASREGVKYFSILGSIYDFFSASTRRWGVLTEHLEKKFSVKRLSTTRWSSRIDAIRPFRYNPQEIYDALIEISEDVTFEANARYEAESLAQKMLTFSFCCCTILWHTILNQINLVSKTLQNINLNISEAVTMLRDTLTFLQNFRSDEKFEDVISEAESLAENLNIEKTFPPAVTIRRRLKKKMFSYETPDEPIPDPKQKFKIECFFAIVDAAITSVRERFEQLREHEDIFRFLYNISSLKTFPKQELQKCCDNLSAALSDNEQGGDIDSVQLYDELLALMNLVKPNTSPAEVLEFIAKNDFFTPNTAVALRILLTLPVTVASGERSFSKLKRIKTYLRSTIGQERLSGLALIAIENEIAKEIDLKEVIREFAQIKARRVVIN